MIEYDRVTNYELFRSVKAKYSFDSDSGAIDVFQHAHILLKCGGLIVKHFKYK